MINRTTHPVVYIARCNSPATSHTDAASSSIGSSDCIEHVFIPRVHGSNHYGGKNTTRGVVIKLVTSSGASASVWLVAGLLQNPNHKDRHNHRRHLNHHLFHLRGKNKTGMIHSD